MNPKFSDDCSVNKTPRISIPPEVRQYVLERDRHQCQSCGKTTQQSPLHIDHIIPLAKGGTNDLSNLHTLCQRCNLGKGDRLDPRFSRHYYS
jgi:5-methylcytosine-specific restriction endonuclease McrA